MTTSRVVYAKLADRDIQWLDHRRPDGFERLVRAIQAAGGHAGARPTSDDGGARRRRPAPHREPSTAPSSASGSRRLGRQIAAGAAGGFGMLVVFLSVVDAGGAGISERGLAIGALCLGVACGLWPRRKESRRVVR